MVLAPASVKSASDLAKAPAFPRGSLYAGSLGRMCLLAFARAVHWYDHAVGYAQWDWGRIVTVNSVILLSVVFVGPETVR